MPQTIAITPARDAGGASAVSGAEPATQGKTTRQDAVASATMTTPELNPPASAEAQGQPATPELAVADDELHSNGEVELKLLVDADRLADFNEAPIIAAHARGQGTRRHLKSVYYDTPKRTLWRNGLSLRVRQSGTRFTQTVKAESGDDPLRRGEWEASVPSMTPVITLAMPFIPEKLRADLDADSFEAVFVADVHRHLRIIDLPTGTIEVAFDHGVLKAGERSLPVNEIELELKSGSRTTLYEVAQRLAEHGPVTPSIRAKSARGFDLAADAPPAARKPPKLRLAPSIPLDDVFVTILRACLLHLLQSIPAAEDGRDPEGIHQLRVALRRLRSVFNLMQSVGPLSRLEALRSEAKWLAQSFSAARDWDIFASSTLPKIATACPAISGFDALAEVADKRRADAYRKARFVLADRRCASFVLALGAWIEARGWRSDVAPEDLAKLSEPAIGFARRVLSEQYNRVLKRGRHFKSLDASERHRLRLAVKKLRYTADFLLPLSAPRKSARRFSEKLTDLQEELGAYNDMATTKSLLSGLGAASLASGHAQAAITGWQAHAMVGAESRLREAWGDFSKAKAPWLRGATDQSAPPD